MYDEKKECLGEAVANGTLRFFGSIVRNVFEGVYFLAPFLRPKEESPTTHTPFVKPLFVPKPRREEAPAPVYVPKSEVFHKQEPEPSKPSPFKAIFEAVKPVFHEKVEEKSVPRVERRPEPVSVKPGANDAFLKGIPFSDRGELIRAEVYVKDFTTGSPRMRRDALEQIRSFPSSVAVEILRRLMEGQKDSLVQMELLDVLSGLNHDGALDKRFFKEYLKNENSILRLAAVRAFSKYKDEESYEILAAAMHDTDPEIRKRALSLILTSFEKRAGILTLRALTDSDASVRKNAVSICGILRLKTAISSLISLLGDPERDVQKAANESLKKITGQDFDFVANSSQGNKRGAIEAWRFWWRSHQNNFGSRTPVKAPVAVAAPVRQSKLVLGQL